MTFIHRVFSQGLEQPRERWCLAACLLLCMVYGGAFAALQLASTRMDTRFLAERERVRLSRLLPLPVERPVGLVENGHVSRFMVLGDGWSEPESWGAWTDGAQADLAVRLPQVVSGQSYLKIWAQISVPPGGQQTIALDAENTRLGRWHLGSPSATLCVPLPELRAASSGVMKVHVGIASPQRAPAGPDHRALGFGLGGIELLLDREGCGSAAIFPSG